MDARLDAFAQRAESVLARPEPLLPAIRAARWATGRGNRNGLCAYQFARYWVGLKLLEQPQ
ncbi:putative AAA+ superfamily ATPase [Pseudomonas sp. TE3610]